MNKNAKKNCINAQLKISKLEATPPEAGRVVTKWLEENASSDESVSV